MQNILLFVLVLFTIIIVASAGVLAHHYHKYHKLSRKKALAIGAGLLIIGSTIPIILDEPAAPSGTFYVATTGSDSNTGTIGSPFKTLRKAINASSTSAFIYIRGGTYNFSKVVVNRSGTAADWYSIMGYPGETAIIQSNMVEMFDDNATLFIRGISYVKISGLTIRNSRCYGITVRDSTSHHIKFDNLTIHNCSAAAIYVYKSGTAAHVQNVVVENCTCYDINNNIAGYNAQEGISFSGVDNFTIQHNYVYQCGKESIDMKSGSCNGTCHDNRVNTTPKIHNATWYAVIGIYASGSGTGNSGYVSNISIFNNNIWGNRTGICVSGETGATSENITIYNNIINLSCNDPTIGGNGIMFNNNADNSPTYDLKIYCNTVFSKYYYGNTLKSTESSSSYIHRVNFSNNILSGYTYYYAYLGCSFATYTKSHNLYYRYNGTTRTHYSDGDSQFETSYVNSNPLFVNKNTYDFHINSTSPAIGAATSSLVPATDYDDNTRPQDTTYDIGAYEYLYSTTGYSVATVRTNGIDYFVWMGQNTSAYWAEYNITGLDELSEYIAIWNHSGNWTYFYGDDSGNNFTVHTYDIIRTYMDDASGTVSFQMVNNTDISYTAYGLARTVTLTWVNTGYNYTAYTILAGTTLSAINTSLTLIDGYVVGVWSKTTYTWSWWISGFTVTDANVAQYSIILTKIPSTKTWVQ